MAKNQGKQFEEDWKGSYKELSFFYLRLIDTAKWQQGQGSKFTPSNPCDAIQFTIPFVWLLELKSTEGASISFNPYREEDELIVSAPWKKPDNEKTKVMIKYNQVEDLYDFAQSEGVLAGFIFNFRERQLKSGTTPNQTYFVHINDFVDFAKDTGKSSISCADCREIGVEISGTKKKVHYKYDVQKFVNDAVHFYVDKKYITIELLERIRDRMEKLIKFAKE